MKVNKTKWSYLEEIRAFSRNKQGYDGTAIQAMNIGAVGGCCDAYFNRTVIMMHKKSGVMKLDNYRSVFLSHVSKLFSKVVDKLIFEIAKL